VVVEEVVVLGASAPEVVALADLVAVVVDHLEEVVPVVVGN
jgi:hypothetical protein